jgi:hypothetical protein
MKRQLHYKVCLLLGCLILPLPSAFSQTSIDQELLAAILKIKAVDNHSHGMPARRPDPVESERLDPLGKAPFEYPVRLRVNNAEHLEAWQAMYGYKYQDMTADHAREALKIKLRLMEEKALARHQNFTAGARPSPYTHDEGWPNHTATRRGAGTHGYAR